MKDILSIENKVFRVALLILAIISLGVWAFYIHCSEPDLKLSELTKIVTGGLVIIGLMYSILTYESNQKKNRHDIRVQKCTATYKAIGEWHTSPMIDYSKICTEFERTPTYKLLKTDVPTFIKEFDKPEHIDYKKSVICIFNYFESMAVAVNENLMDEVFMRKYFSNIFNVFYTDYIDFIKERRRIKKNDDIWLEFTTLAERWNNPQLLKNDLCK